MHPSDSTNQQDGQGRATSSAGSTGMNHGAPLFLRDDLCLEKPCGRLIGFLLAVFIGIVLNGGDAVLGVEVVFHVAASLLWLFSVFRCVFFSGEDQADSLFDGLPVGASRKIAEDIPGKPLGCAEVVALLHDLPDHDHEVAISQVLHHECVLPYSSVLLVSIQEPCVSGSAQW